MRVPAILLVVGSILALSGIATRGPDRVTIQAHARRDVAAVYWKTTLREPRVRDGASIRQRIINAYRSPPLPFPERMPPYRVRLEMTLLVSEPGEYGFELGAPQWFGYLEVDGTRVFGNGPFQPGASTMGSVRLREGRHPLVLVVQPRAGAEGELSLLWRPPGGGLERVRPRDLAAVEASTTSALFHEGPLGTLFGLGVGLILLAGVVLAMSGLDSTSGWQRASVAFALFGCALVVRFAQYDSVPRQNVDEFHNAWAGVNLFENGKPSSWSWLPGQEKEFVDWFDYGYPYVEYAFDHPPALPIVVGATSLAMGVRSIFDCVLPIIRLPMVIIGASAVVAAFLLGWVSLGSRVALWGGMLMAFSPLSVFNSRLVKEDNLTQLWILVAVLIFVVAGASRRGQIASGLSAGAAAFSKMMGISVAFALAALAFVRPTPWRDIGRIAVPAAGVAALYPLYGWLIDWEAFSATFSHLALAYPDESLADKGRIIARLVLEPKVNNNLPYFDGWILFGWLSLYLIRDRLELLVPFVLYVLILVVTVRADSLWGFYSIPLYPFLFLAAGAHLERVFEEQGLFSSFAVISLCIVPSVLASESLSILGVFSFRVLMTLCFVPLIPAALGPRRAPRLYEANRFLLVGLVVAALLASVETCLTTV